MQNKYFTAQHIEEAYVLLNRTVLENYEYQTKSRIGDTFEIFNIGFELSKQLDYWFDNPNATKITKEYAEDFWNFMISGGTDAEEVFKAYPNVSKFISKPLSKELPENFNTFYGPRIVKQLPRILEELKTKENSRRAVIQILQESDQELLNKDEFLEYPCCDSITLYIRDGKLNSHVHMRSQNTAVVFHLDLFLQGKFLQYISKQLDIEYNILSFSIVSAHIYEKDIEYLEGILYSGEEIKALKFDTFPLSEQIFQYLIENSKNWFLPFPKINENVIRNKSGKSIHIYQNNNIIYWPNILAQSSYHDIIMEEFNKEELEKLISYE